MLKSIVFICICLPVFLVSCVATPPSFDEKDWQQTVAAQDPALLYAPHFENGVYFNPWMPMQTDRLGQFLKWRFSKKAAYTHEERSYLPQVRPDLAGRIQESAEKDSITWIGHATFLWASYLLVSPDATIYYGGDSGYFVGYREIGKYYPGIDYALMPLTAYHPRWFMHYPHMNATESIQAFQDLGARYFIPTQWGTFKLGDNPPGYPALDLKKKIARQGLEPSRFVIMDIGQIEVIRKDR